MLIFSTYFVKQSVLATKGIEINGRKYILFTKNFGNLNTMVCRVVGDTAMMSGNRLGSGIELLVTVQHKSVDQPRKRYFVMLNT